MKFSIYQEKIFEVLIKTNKNIVVQATAGAGKTTTILECLKFVPKFKRTIFLSFSNAIVKELKSRVPVGVQASTLHSKGYQLLIKHFGDDVKKIEEDKFFKKALFTFYKDKEKKEKEDFKNCYRIQDICSFVRMSLTSLEFEKVKDICEYYNIDYTDELLKQSIQLLEEKETFRGGIDFVDMLYLPVKLDIVDTKYDYIFLDEAQDLNECQYQFIMKLKSERGGRLIAVGDENQCQPGDTLVTLRDGSVKQIKDLQVGESVVSYDLEHGSNYVNYSKKKNSRPIKNGVVLEKQSRLYSDLLFTVELENGMSSRYTKEHICCFKMIDDAYLQQKFMVYLMEKDGLFRIGFSKLWSKTNGFGLTMRCSGEGANKGWILGIFDSKEEAYIHESLYSYKFGIPKLVFKDGGWKDVVLASQTCIDRFWSLIDKKDLYQKGLDCLRFFQKDIRYPFYSRNGILGDKKNVRNSDKFLSYTFACNLIPEVMMCNIFDIENKSEYGVLRKYIKIKDIKKEKVENLEVISLKVSGTGLYVGDNILTHNCIYGFMGSSVEIFNKLQQLPNTETLTLPVSYRCGKRIVQEAKRTSTLIQPFEDNHEGIVRGGNFDEIDQGDIILSRITRPLIYLYFLLLDEGKKSTIVGKDIEKGLVNLAKRCESSTYAGLLYNFQQEQNRLKDELVALGCRNLLQHQRYIELDEKIQVLMLIVKKCPEVSRLVDKIKEIFADSTDSIRLMTIHKSKGLENERVFLITRYQGEKLLPNKHAQKDWEHLQENNLEFVAYTRAKNELVFLDIE